MSTDAIVDVSGLAARVNAVPKLYRKAGKVFGGTWANNIIRFLLGVYTVRVFGAAGKGEMAILSTLPGTLSSLLSLGVGSSLAYFHKRGRLVLHAYWGFILGSLTLVALVSLAVLILAKDFIYAHILAGASREAQVLWYVPIATVSMVMMLYGKTLVLANGNDKQFQYLAVGSISTAFTVGAIWVEFFDGSLWALLWSLVGADFFFSAVTLCLICRHLPSRRTDFASPASIVGYAAKSHSNVVASAVLSRVDYYVIAAALDLRLLGLYSVADFFRQATLSVPRAVSGLLFGEVAGEGPSSHHRVSEASKRVGYTLFAVAVAVVMVGTALVPFVYGREFAEALPSLYLLQGSAIFLGTSTLLHTYFMGIGRPHLSVSATVVGGLVQAGLIVAAVRPLELVGVCCAMIAGALTTAGVRYSIFRKFQS